MILPWFYLKYLYVQGTASHGMCSSPPKRGCPQSKPEDLSAKFDLVVACHGLQEQPPRPTLALVSIQALKGEIARPLRVLRFLLMTEITLGLQTMFIRAE